MNLFQKNIEFDITLAKIVAVLYAFWEVKDLDKATDIYRKYKAYKFYSEKNILDFKVNNLIQLETEGLSSYIQKYSLFYSYCYDYYKLLPILMALDGCNIIVLIEEKIYLKQKKYFSDFFFQVESYFGKRMNINFVTNRDDKLLLKLRRNIREGSKILFFIDGNLGNNTNETNLVKTRFKKADILFHKGIARLLQVLKEEKLCRLLCLQEEGKIIIKGKEFDFKSHFRNADFENIVVNNLLSDLDDLISIDSLSRWDALVSCYQWLDITKKNKNSEKELTIPFKISREYYLLRTTDFCVDRVGYFSYRKNLKKFYKNMNRE